MAAALLAALGVRLVLRRGEPADDGAVVEFEPFVPVAPLHDPATIALVKSLMVSAGIRYCIRNERVADFAMWGWGLPTSLQGSSAMPTLAVEPARVEEARALLANAAVWDATEAGLGEVAESD